MKITLHYENKSMAGKVIEVPQAGGLVGRSRGCHIVISEASVSRQHCQLFVTAGQFIVKDLGSRHGTLVNGERVTDEHPVHDGDQLALGRCIFQVKAKQIAVSTPDAPEPLQSGSSSLTEESESFADPESVFLDDLNSDRSVSSTFQTGSMDFDAALNAELSRLKQKQAFKSESDDRPIFGSDSQAADFAKDLLDQQQSRNGEDV